jgi:lipopolysaccharide heptosyltransferase II
METSDPQKILIVRLSSIGDIILTTPVLRGLRRRFPQAHIDYVTKASFSGLLDGNPHLHRVWVVPDNAGLAELLSALRTVRPEGYDLLVDLHKNWRSIVLRLGAGSTSATSYRKHVIRRALYVHLKQRSLSLPSATQRYLTAVAPLGVVDDGEGPELFLKPSLLRDTERRLRGYGWEGEAAIGLVPGAGYYTKRWPIERYAELGRRLEKTFKRQLFVFGGPEDKEMGRFVAERVGSAALNLAARLSLMESAAALSRCELVVANDTGLMHVADALGKKLVAIFGSTTEGLGFFPHGHDVRTVQTDVACRPCSHLGKRRCPKKHFRCMLDVPVEQVERESEALCRQPLTVTL